MPATSCFHKYIQSRHSPPRSGSLTVSLKSPNCCTRIKFEVSNSVSDSAHATPQSTTNSPTLPAPLLPYPSPTPDSEIAANKLPLLPNCMASSSQSTLGTTLAWPLLVEPSKKIWNQRKAVQGHLSLMKRLTWSKRFSFSFLNLAFWTFRKSEKLESRVF